MNSGKHKYVVAYAADRTVLYGTENFKLSGFVEIKGRSNVP